MTCCSCENMFIKSGNKKPQNIKTKWDAFQRPETQETILACKHAHVKHFTWHPGITLVHGGKEPQDTTEMRAVEPRPGHTVMHNTVQADQRISIQATGPPQLLMRRRRDREKYPLWWHRLLTQLTPPGLSDHSREAYCYMRSLVLVKTQQQKGLWMKLSKFPGDGL